MVLSSAKLHILDSSKKKTRSLIKMLKSSGPEMEPCGIYDVTSRQSLKVEPIFTLSFLPVTQLTHNYRSNVGYHLPNP